MELDKHQELAVNAPLGKTCVVAAPGSGKTRVLAARFLHMLDSGIPAAEIVVCTFTNYAANEMKNRIGHRGGLAYIGTFHGFALDIIKRYGTHTGWIRG